MQIKIPANYTVEAMAKPVTLKTACGNYAISFSITENVINVIRRNERNQGRFPKEEYEKVLNYFDAIYKADRTKIVLIKKE